MCGGVEGRNWNRTWENFWRAWILSCHACGNGFTSVCVCVCVCVCVLSQVQLFATPWTTLWNSPGFNTGVGNLSLFQEIFPTQGLNPGLPHCRWILYQLSHQGSPDSWEWALFPQPASKHHLGKITTLYFSGIHHSAKQSSGHMEGLQ